MGALESQREAGTPEDQDMKKVFRAYVALYAATTLTAIGLIVGAYIHTQDEKKKAEPATPALVAPDPSLNEENQLP